MTAHRFAGRWRVLAGVAAFGSTGCAGEFIGETGVSVPTKASTGRGGPIPAAAIEGAIGLGPGGERGGGGLELRARGKLGPDIAAASLNGGLFVAFGPRRPYGYGPLRRDQFFFLGNLGVSLIGATYTSQVGPLPRTSTGPASTQVLFRTVGDSGSPYGQFGVGFPAAALFGGGPERPKSPLALLVALSAEYNVRRSDAVPNTAYLGLLIGVGVVSYEGARPSASTIPFADRRDAGDGGPTSTGARPSASTIPFADRRDAGDGGPTSTGARPSGGVRFPVGK
jgi:hypothetical protein